MLAQHDQISAQLLAPLDTGGTIRRVLWVTPGINANVALEVEVRRRDHTLEQSYRWELARYSGRRPGSVRPA